MIASKMERVQFQTVRKREGEKKNKRYSKRPKQLFNLEQKDPCMVEPLQKQR